MKYKVIKQFPWYNEGEVIDTDKQALNFNPAFWSEFFQKVEEKPRTVLDLKEGDLYFYINGLYQISISTWLNSWIDNENWDIWNCFLTREEAEKELEKRKLITKLLRSKHEMWLNKKFVKDERNYFIYEEEGKLHMSYYEHINTLPILWYFTESQEYIDNNKEDLLRLFELTK